MAEQGKQSKFELSIGASAWKSGRNTPMPRRNAQRFEKWNENG